MSDATSSGPVCPCNTAWCSVLPPPPCPFHSPTNGSTLNSPATYTTTTTTLDEGMKMRWDGMAWWERIDEWLHERRWIPRHPLAWRIHRRFCDYRERRYGVPDVLVPTCGATRHTYTDWVHSGAMTRLRCTKTAGHDGAHRDGIAGSEWEPQEETA